MTIINKIEDRLIILNQRFIILDTRVTRLERDNQDIAKRLDKVDPVRKSKDKRHDRTKDPV